MYCTWVRRVWRIARRTNCDLFQYFGHRNELRRRTNSVDNIQKYGGTDFRRMSRFDCTWSALSAGIPHSIYLSSRWNAINCHLFPDQQPLDTFTTWHTRCAALEWRRRRWSHVFHSLVSVVIFRASRRWHFQFSLSLPPVTSSPLVRHIPLIKSFYIHVLGGFCTFWQKLIHSFSIFVFGSDFTSQDKVTHSLNLIALLKWGHVPGQFKQCRHTTNERK